MNSINKHKVFISFHNKDFLYKDKLIKLNNIYDLFHDRSVNTGDISDNNLDETIRRKIRDEYLRDSSVTILLVGNETKYRKYIDWELQASMIDTDLNKRSGIILINLPNINQYIRSASMEEKKLISNSTNLVILNSREEYERAYPYTPSRIIDNFIKRVDISVVDWLTIEKKPYVLKELIDLAYKKRKSCNYDTSKPLRRRNS